MVYLFKKDTKGKLRYLKVWSEGATIFNESGLIGTDSPVIHEKVAKPKNVGKSNETTAEEQAQAEVQSFITKKLKEGYFLTQEEASSEEILLPMLAKSYGDEAHKIDWSTAYCQTKLDGARCIAYFRNNEVILMSRKGSKIENMWHIEEELKDFFTSFPDMVLDGELYVHGESFQKNMSYVKKYQEGLSERISYWVYDTIMDAPYSQREEVLNFTLPSNYEHVKQVPTIAITSEEELKSYHSEFIQEGFEGTMVRWGNEPYKVNGRSSHLLKYKDFEDITATIIDVIPAEQRPEWGVPVFDGFKAGTKLSHEERIDLLTNKENYIGKTAELRFFEYTDDGLPRFPVMVGIRLDK